MPNLLSPDKKISRRDFLKLTGVVAAGLVLPGCVPIQETEIKISQKKTSQTATAQAPKTETEILAEHNAPPEIIPRTIKLQLFYITDGEYYRATGSGYILETRSIEGKNFALIATAGHILTDDNNNPCEITRVHLNRPQIDDIDMVNETSSPIFNTNYVRDGDNDFGFMLIEIKPEYNFQPLKVITQSEFQLENFFGLGFFTALENSNITLERIPFVINPDQISSDSKHKFKVVQSSSPASSGTILVNQEGNPAAIHTESKAFTSKAVFDYFPDDYEDRKKSLYDQMEQILKLTRLASPISNP